MESSASGGGGSPNDIPDVASAAGSDAGAAQQAAADLGSEMSQTLTEELITFFSSPLNLALTLVAAWIFYRLFKGNSKGKR